MPDSIKENCVKLVGLINQLESCQNKLNKSKEKSVLSPISLGSLINAVKEKINFHTEWNEQENTVIIEKNDNNYLIILNPDKILFKVDNYTLDVKETTIDILKTGPWIERFEKFVENRITGVDLLIETEKRMEYDSKFGEVDF